VGGEHLGQPLAAGAPALRGQLVDGALREPLVSFRAPNRDQARIAEALDHLVEVGPLADVDDPFLAPGLHPALDAVGVERASAEHAQDGQRERRGADTGLRRHAI